MPVRIKICGITQADDALLAAELGADALGFILYAKSKRAMTIEAAAAICRRLPPFVARVGVFVDETEEVIRQAIRACRLTTVQFHGDESPEFCRRFAGEVSIIKAIRVKDAASLAAATGYEVDALLLDTYTAASHGGTGQTFDWSLAVQAKQLGRPIVLSGGLTTDNVAKALRVVRPYAVDVASGVERAPGQKDAAKLRRFISQCQANEN
jgi:phosphoribosylanthranilate isomerase